jgi:alkylation response protein AidB-like acyl-CoA dehydrogenase
MTIPTRYGGSDRSGVERCLVISELLAAGAPLGAHWTADRQTAPSLLLNGPESLRQRLLPEIAAGRCLMAGGFSEPDSGSDLASVRTRARKVDGGWRITGRKIWTTDADQADYIEVLCRTADAPRKHEGLSLVVVPMSAEGIGVQPIEGMDGERHFNEVTLDDVFAADDWLIGTPGKGWEQLTAELALERGGPERYLTTMPMFEAFVASRSLAPDPGLAWELIGDVVAQQMGLREMTLSIARLVDDGGSPVAEAAMAKDLGTELEQLLVDDLWEYRSEPLRPGDDRDRFHEFLDINRLRSAVFTTAGGTNEVLRLLVARQLDSWAARRATLTLGSDTAETTADHARKVASEGVRSVPRGEVDQTSLRLTETLQEGGFLGVSVPEELGGAGGSLDDALDVLSGAAYEGMSIPMVEGPIAAGWLLAEAGIHFDWSTGIAVLAGGVGGAAAGTPGAVRTRAPWAEQATAIVTADVVDGRVQVALWPRERVSYTAGADLAGEPIAHSLSTGEAAPTALAFIERPVPEVVAGLEGRCALARAAAISAALQRCAALTVEYAGQREQFGQPIARFQAVQTHLTRIASEAERAAVLVAAARARFDADDPEAAHAAAVAARVLTGRAAIVVARTAHQVHGAIGVTMEYPLQRYTRRLYEWASREATTRAWARRLGEQACARPLGAWALITGVDEPPVHPSAIGP